jgi:hypothetical protein
MRRGLLLACLVFAALPVGSALANAAKDNQTPANPVGYIQSGWIGSPQGGNNMTTTQYSASYWLFGATSAVQCRGVHQVGKSTTALGTDSFTCTSTTGLPIAGLSPGQSLTQANFGWWQSDYWALTGNPYVVVTDFTGAVSLDGMSFTGIAPF